MKVRAAVVCALSLLTAAVAPAEDRVAPQTMNMETEVRPAQPAVSEATRLVASPYRSTYPRMRAAWLAISSIIFRVVCAKYALFLKKSQCP